MAKRGLYSLADEEFAHFVTELGKSFDRAKVPYIFVGGTAVQMHSLKRLHKRFDADVVELAKKNRLQDYLRATDDVDMALSQEAFSDRDDIRYARVINSILNDVCGRESFSPSQEHILEYKLARVGVKRPVFNIVMDGETNDDQRVMLNIGRRPHDLRGVDSGYYQRFVDEGEVITVPYNPDYSISARVISPTYLLATKTANFRPKDTMDIHSLADLMRDTGEVIDIDTIRKILGPEFSVNFGRLLTLVDTPSED